MELLPISVRSIDRGGGSMQEDATSCSSASEREVGACA